LGLHAGYHQRQVLTRLNKYCRHCQHQQLLTAKGTSEEARKQQLLSSKQ
jgi:hypothetical protein